MKYVDIINKKVGQYPIGAWVPFYEHNLNAEYFAQMRECGINFIPTRTCEKKELDIIGGSGLKIMVNDDRVTYANVTEIAKVKDYLSEYAKRDDVISVFVWDEPSPTMMDLCAVINKQINKNCDDVFGYINLHPNYSDKDIQRDGLSYAEYLQYFVDTCKPKVISYDHYPFFVDKIGFEEMFENLDEIRKCCNNNGLEFVTFIQSAEYYRHVLPTCEMLRCQVATNLAYGAKGIIYFTYSQVIHDENKESFGPAVLDKNGNKTHVYDDIKQINGDIQKNGNLFMQLNHKGVVFFSEKFAEFSTVTPNFKVDCDDILVGVFEKDGETYLYPVNLCLDEPKSVTVTYGGKAYSVTLEAGWGRLLKV